MRDRRRDLLGAAGAAERDRVERDRCGSTPALPVIGVAMWPGAIALTVTPKLASSSAITFDGHAQARPSRPSRRPRTAAGRARART